MAVTGDPSEASSDADADADATDTAEGEAEVSTTSGDPSATTSEPDTGDEGDTGTAPCEGSQWQLTARQLDANRIRVASFDVGCGDDPFAPDPTASCPRADFDALITIPGMVYGSYDLAEAGENVSLVRRGYWPHDGGSDEECRCSDEGIDDAVPITAGTLRLEAPTASDPRDRLRLPDLTQAGAYLEAVPVEPPC